MSLLLSVLKALPGEERIFRMEGVGGGKIGQNAIDEGENQPDKDGKRELGQSGPPRTWRPPPQSYALRERRAALANKQFY